MKLLRPVRANRAAAESIPKVGTDFSDVEINYGWSGRTSAPSAPCSNPLAYRIDSVSGSEWGLAAQSARGRKCDPKNKRCAFSFVVHTGSTLHPGPPSAE